MLCCIEHSACSLRREGRSGKIDVVIHDVIGWFSGADFFSESIRTKTGVTFETVGTGTGGLLVL